jgi:hypothetical protein
MADKTVSDQPTVYTLDTLRDLYGEEREAAQGMLDTIQAAAKGSEIVLPLEDGSGVRYVWDGSELLFRADTKPAEVLRRGAERSVAKHG